MSRDKFIPLVFRVLKDYGVSITLRSIEQEVNTHPEYPSMQSISDALDRWKVKHIVMQLTLEKLRALDVPVIAHLKQGEFIWVTQITDSAVHYWSATDKEKVETLDRFEQEWSGVALAINSVDDAGEPDYREKRGKERKEQIFKSLIAGGILVLVTVLTWIAWANDGSLSLFPKLLMFFTNVAGCYVSYLLVLQEKRQSDVLTDKFCKVGKYIDCKKVTDSKYSSFFGIISWAELGAACFGSMLLWVAVAPLSDGWLPPLGWISLLVLPFTLWSLATQAFVIRKWCLFCCALVFLLWTNAVILLVFYSQLSEPSIPNAAMLALLFIFSLVAVVEASKTIGSKARLYSQQREMEKIKYSFRTIQSHLSDTSQSIGKPGLSFGNPASPHDFCLFISASCSHCRKAVKELRRLIEIYPDFSYRLLFSVNSDDFDNKTNAIINRLINLNRTMSKNDFFDMLDTWYSMPEKSMETLQKAYQLASVQDCKVEIDALYHFNRQNIIKYTPAILINEKLLSEVYSHNDLYGIVRAFNAET